MKDEYISAPDLAVIREARMRVDIAAQAVELLQLKAFIRYGLTERDSFDIATGRITRHVPDPDPQTSDEEVPVP